MYPTNSANPGQGARLWAPCVSEKIDRPASKHTFVQTRFGVGYKLEPEPKTDPAA